jgi:hypothetical protein
MSKIESTPLELSEIVKEANLIVEVECMESFTEDVAIRSEDPKAPAPSFKKKGFVFRLKKVLKNPDKIDVPQTIRVPQEDWRRSLSKHQERYAGGVSKSFSIREYETEVASMKKASILFIHHFQDTFELEAKNSFESVEALEKVMMLIEVKRQTLPQYSSTKKRNR